MAIEGHAIPAHVDLAEDRAPLGDPRDAAPRAVAQPPARGQQLEIARVTERGVAPARIEVHEHRPADRVVVQRHDLGELIVRARWHVDARAPRWTGVLCDVAGHPAPYATTLPRSARPSTVGSAEVRIGRSAGVVGLSLAQAAAPAGSASRSGRSSYRYPSCRRRAPAACRR